MISRMCVRMTPRQLGAHHLAVHPLVIRHISGVDDTSERERLLLVSFGTGETFARGKTSDSVMHKLAGLHSVGKTAAESSLIDLPIRETLRVVLSEARNTSRRASIHLSQCLPASFISALKDVDCIHAKEL